MISTLGCNVVGLASNVAAAVYGFQLADLNLQAAAALSGGNSTQAQFLLAEVDTATYNVGAVQSVQQFCEVVVCVIIIVAYIAAGYQCRHRVRQGLFAVSQAVGSVNERSSLTSSPPRSNLFDKV